MNKINKKHLFKQIFSIVASVLLLVAHVFVVIAFIKAARFYSIYPKVFNYLIIIIICIFAIIDIVFFIGLKHNDLLQKIIVCVMAILLGAGSVYGTVVLAKTNTLVDNVMDTGVNEKTETVSGIFVTYDDKYQNITELTQLKSFSNLKIGMMAESGDNTISSFGIAELETAGVKGYKTTTFTNNTDLLFALIGGNIDIALFSNMYKAVFRADENVDYTQYLDKMNEFGEFEKEVVLESNTSLKDLSKDPFNVLLIGWSPIQGSTTIGLADAIIVATVNPQTYTVSMMSIARDSYVPISCYGGECDKINSGRGTSMECFVSTVETLIKEPIDFYMEINFAGFAELCGELGGIEINNPVSFELDGIYVPAGNYVADGWQTLQFARERHHMPNGDFDRQQHQKEVIMQIAKKFLKHDLTFALDVFNEISNSLNTNLTFNQLSGVFNMLTSTKNYTGVSLFDMLDMHALRITGYADWHYSDDFELPLWIYRLYDGSISESLEHLENVMGNYKSINQDKGFSFSIDTPYERPAFYSLEYNETEIHEELPPYYTNLSGMTYEEVVEWANLKGATLTFTYIDEDDAAYDESLDGYVVDQSVAYGKKVSKYPVCNVTIMGTGTIKAKLPEDYDGWSVDRAKEWCKTKQYNYEVVPYYVAKGSETEYEVSKMKIEDNVIYITYYVFAPENSTVKDGTFTCKDGYTYVSDTGTCSLFYKVPSDIKAKSAGTYNDGKFNYVYVEEYSFTVAKGSIISISPSVGTTVSAGSTITVTVSKGTDPDYAVVPNFVGTNTTTSSDFTIDASAEEYSSKVAQGYVISQSVEAGSYAKRGSTIKLTISKGIEYVIVPKFVGTTTTSSEILTVTVIEEYSDDVEKGVVISQDLSADSSVAKGSTITLVVSLGKKPVEEPKVQETN